MKTIVPVDLKALKASELEAKQGAHVVEGSV